MKCKEAQLANFDDAMGFGARAHEPKDDPDHSLEQIRKPVHLRLQYYKTQ